MAKRMQEEKGEDRTVAKSKPTLNLVSHAATSSSAGQSPVASKTCSERTKSKRRSVEFSRVAKGCRDGQEYEETRSSKIRRSDPTLQDNELLQDDFAEHVHHVGSSRDLH